MKSLIASSLILASTISLVKADDIILSKSIKSDLRQKIVKDLEVLNNFKFNQNTDKETLKLLNINSLTAETAKSWLGERVNYVIEENALTLYKLLIKKVIFVERSGVTFPNQTVIPYSSELNSESILGKESEAMTVMSNIGAALYMGGKKEQKVYGMKISRGLLKSSIKALAESPRVGIIQIGEGLFDQNLTINNQNQASIANSIHRLATFFHEARHSDGNGKSLAFAHAKCPIGHEYEGEAACDENLNGPYTVGARMLVEMAKSCEGVCNARETEILKAVALDSFNRVLKKTNKGEAATHWDDTPESL